MTQSADVLVTGGGASGLLAAIGAARCGDQVLVLEKYDRPGRKLLATGNGRCNLMNRGQPVYYGDTAFALRVMQPDYLKVLTEFWYGIGVLLRYDAEGRGYPCTYQAATVLNAILAECQRLGVRILTGAAVTSLRRIGSRYEAETSSGVKYTARRLILATGGAAQPRLGGNKDAFPWLERMGHRIQSISPALTALRTDARSISGLSGLRVRCELTLETDGFIAHREKGELLFTESGLSGICVMQCSRFAVAEHSQIRINLVPDLFSDADALFCELVSRQERFRGNFAQDILLGICAPKMAYAVCKQAGLPLRGEKIYDLTEDQLHQIAATLMGYRVQLIRVEGFERAQVMAGGLDCGDFSPENLESKLCPGLHVTGELLNVDGDCGGFNLMFASISGLKAGMNGRRGRNGRA